MALSDNIVTNATSGNNDDGFVKISLPWSISLLRRSFDTIYVGTNSLLIFTSSSYAAPDPTYVNYTFGSSATGVYDLTVPAFLGSSLDDISLQIGFGDNTMQRVQYGQDYDGTYHTFRIRYEGTSTFGNSNQPVGNSNIAWEIVFTVEDFSRIELYVDAMPLVNTGTLTFGMVDRSPTLSLTSQGTFNMTNVKSQTAWRILPDDGNPNGNNIYVTYVSIDYSARKLFHISGTAGTLLIGDPQLPVYSGLGDVCFNPGNWGSQVNFHSQRKYLKINGIISTLAGTFPAVLVDYRTWADPSSKGC